MDWNLYYLPISYLKSISILWINLFDYSFIFYIYSTYAKLWKNMTVMLELLRQWNL